MPPEDQYDDPHAECAYEIESLRTQLDEARREVERLRSPDGGRGVEAWRKCYKREQETVTKLERALREIAQDGCEHHGHDKGPADCEEAQPGDPVSWCGQCRARAALEEASDDGR